MMHIDKLSILLSIDKIIAHWTHDLKYNKKIKLINYHQAMLMQLVILKLDSFHDQ